MLFETKTERILLKKEIEYIEKFVALQKIRTNNEHYVDFKIEGNYENRRIAPLVFIPFIENAFKHSINKKLDETISIHIVITENSVKLDCKNKMDVSRKKDVISHGLGQELIGKRLQLLYPNKHTLVINKAEDFFHISLTINDEEI